MKKEKKIQIIINIVTVINIGLIIWLGYHLAIRNKYTVSYIKRLLGKNSQCMNYMLEREYESASTENIEHVVIMQKEDARRVDTISGDYIDTRWSTNDLVIVETKQDNRKEYFELNYREMSPLKFEMNIDTYTDRTFQYIGKEKYHNKDCIVLYYEHTSHVMESIEKTYYINNKVWIEEETGFIVREEQYKDNESNELVTATTYDVKLNCVTDKDINLPDLKDFKKIKIDGQ